MDGSALHFSTAKFHKPYTRLKTKMNLPRICLLAVLLLRIGFPAYGQVVQEPILVDEYSSTPCDDFVGRLDSFLSELRTHQDSRGLIVLGDTSNSRVWTAELQSMIEVHILFRGFDAKRIEIVRRDAPEQVRQFWRIPDGADSPRIERRVNGFDLSGTSSKPFVVAEETTMGTQICPDIDRNKLFASFLRANPNARGNVVVRDNQRSRGLRTAAKIRRRLASKYRVTRNRLRFFVERRHRPADYNEAIVEYWYLP